jgi:transposase
MTAIVCKDKQNVNAVINLHSTPVEGNFCDEHSKTGHKCLDKSDHMTNSYHISRQIWEWIKKAIFSLLDFTILTSCGSKLSHQQFGQTLLRDLIQELGKVPQNQTTRRGRQAPSTS